MAPGDPAALRATLQDLLDAPERRASLARRALATARAHPTWAESMERVRQFLRATAGLGGTVPDRVSAEPADTPVSPT